MTPPPLPGGPEPPSHGAAGWAEAAHAARLLAVDPAGLGGAWLRARPGPVRDRWLALLRAVLPDAAPLRRLPPGAPDSRLLGGLDLAATLRAGRPVVERGVLAGCDGGVVVLAMAERLDPVVAGRVAAALDGGEVLLERDGLGLRLPARLGAVALDEGGEDDEPPPAALTERLGFWIDLDGIAAAEAGAGGAGDAGREAEVGAARARLACVRTGDEAVSSLCAAAAALGIGSLRAPLLALRAARAAAALAGRGEVAVEDAALAARLVLGPRARQLPPAEAAPPAEEAASGNGEAPPPEDDAQPPRGDGQKLDEVVLAAARAAVPPHLLGSLAAPGPAPRGAASAGRSGRPRGNGRRGVPVGTMPGRLRPGARISLVETLRAAAPWQRLRRAGRTAPHGASPARPELRLEDIRLVRFRERTATTALFVVDASGSAALHRLAEAKGAVELLLADCYARRDRVSLLAFRGAGSALLLPPTSSLARAKRCLAGLPGGGGTPLAAGLDAAAALAGAERRAGRTPLVVVLTDGQANVARDGAFDRARAAADAHDAARRLRAGGAGPALLIDTAPRPRAQAERLAAEMGARYLPLPFAGSAAALSRTVRAAAEAAR